MERCQKICEKNAEIRELIFLWLINVEDIPCVNKSQKRFKCTYRALDKDKNIVERVYLVTL